MLSHNSYSSLGGVELMEIKGIRLQQQQKQRNVPFFQTTTWRISTGRVINNNYDTWRDFNWKPKNIRQCYNWCGQRQFIQRALLCYIKLSSYIWNKWGIRIYEEDLTVLLIHDAPLDHSSTDFISVVQPAEQQCPEKRTREKMFSGIIVALKTKFNIEAKCLPLSFRKWHFCVSNSLIFWLTYATNSPSTNRLRHHHNCCDEDSFQTCIYPKHISHKPRIMTCGDERKIIYDGYQENSKNVSVVIYNLLSMYGNSLAPSSITQRPTPSTRSSETDDNDSAHFPIFESKWQVDCAALATAIPSVGTAYAAAKIVSGPNTDEIGEPKDLNNYIANSGASSHMTPRLDDLFDVE